jgi:hypothetical protein
MLAFASICVQQLAQINAFRTQDPVKPTASTGFMERAMGIEQIRMNQTKALPPVPQFNWSQMESTTLNCTIPYADGS